jgi:uncharacterized protein YcfJ
MKKISAIVLALALSTAIAGCSTTEKTTGIGVASGALLGQAIGGDTESTLIGAAAGGVAGFLLGKSLERKGYCRYQKRNGDIYEAPCPR